MKNFVLNLKLKKRKSVVLTLLSFVFLFSLGFNCSASFFNKKHNVSISNSDIKKFSKHEKVLYFNDEDGKWQLQQYGTPSLDNNNQFDPNATVLVRRYDEASKKSEISVNGKVIPTKENAIKLSFEEFCKYREEFGDHNWGYGRNHLHNFDEPESCYGDLCPTCLMI